MPSPIAHDKPDASTVRALLRKVVGFATRRIWLPRLVYASLPYFYLAAGLAALLATLYVSEWFWVVPHYLLFAAACMHGAFIVLRWRRRGRKSSRSGHRRR